MRSQPRSEMQMELFVQTFGLLIVVIKLALMELIMAESGSVQCYSSFILRITSISIEKCIIKIFLFYFKFYAIASPIFRFDNVRIPRENLLNSVADVSPDGQYLSAIKDPDQVITHFFFTSIVHRLIQGPNFGIVQTPKPVMALEAALKRQRRFHSTIVVAQSI